MPPYVPPIDDPRPDHHATNFGPIDLNPMIKFRKATARDAKAIARVYVDTWRDAYAGMIPDQILIGMSHRRHSARWSMDFGKRRNGQMVMVAEDSRAGVVGFGSCGRARYADLPYDGEVYTLYVLTDYQGLGVGKSLLGELFSALFERGSNSALIWVLAENPARFFYQAMGGKRVAVRKDRLGRASLPTTAYGWSDLKQGVSRTRLCSIS